LVLERGGSERRRRSVKADHDLPPLRLADRVALRPKEAAEALGISERTIRQLLPELPTVRRGNIVLIPVEPLRKWLREESEAEKSRAEAVVGEILKAVGSGGKD
jgi:excisionase family DNA binding protein